MSSHESTSRTTENAASGNTTSSKQAHGIDIRQALEILASRNSHGHSHVYEHSHAHEHSPAHGNEQAACHRSATDEAKTMGQTIDLNASAKESSASPQVEMMAQSMEETKQELDKARKAREVDIRAHLQSMSVKDLLQAVMEAQRERVATYRDFDSGLETVLQTGNMTEYPNICARATASFSVLSDTINTIASILKDVHKRPDLVTLLSQLQKEERDKLNVTAALHLERIRERNLKMHVDGDEGVSRLLHKGVTSLKRKVATCIDAINDVLEEIRYELAEEDE